MKSRSFFKPKHARTGLALRLFAYICFLGAFALGEPLRHSLLLVPLFFAVFAVGAWSFKMSRRLRSRIVVDLPALRAYLNTNHRRLILYLREFVSDNSALYNPHAPGSGDIKLVTDEERIVSRLCGYGLVLTVGRPGERLPPGGAYRLYLRDEVWKQEVSDLVDRADAIVFRCGRTQGVRWELSCVVDKRKLERTIFVNSGTDSNLSTLEGLRQLAHVSTLGFDGEAPSRNSFDESRRSVSGGIAVSLDHRSPSQKRPSALPPRLLAILEYMRTLDAIRRRVALAQATANAKAVFVVKDGTIRRLPGGLDDALYGAIGIVGLKRRDLGIIDTVDPWSIENVVRILSLMGFGLMLLFAVVLFVLPPLLGHFGFHEAISFVETNVWYYEFVALALFLLRFIII